MDNHSTPDVIASAPAPEPRGAPDEHHVRSRAVAARLLRRRARALLSLAMLGLPAFALAHALLLPPAKLPLAASHLALLLACAIAREVAARPSRPGPLRSLLCRTYTLLFAGAAMLCVQLASFAAQAPALSHFLALSFFILIALSIPILRLPAQDLEAIALRASPSLAVAICWAPSAMLPVYLIGFGVAVFVVWRLSRLGAARPEEALASDSSGVRPA